MVGTKQHTSPVKQRFVSRVARKRDDFSGQWLEVKRAVRRRCPGTASLVVLKVRQVTCEGIANHLQCLAYHLPCDGIEGMVRRNDGRRWGTER